VALKGAGRRSVLRLRPASPQCPFPTATHQLKRTASAALAFQAVGPEVGHHSKPANRPRRGQPPDTTATKKLKSAVLICRGIAKVSRELILNFTEG
jgi:hypothetical protein